MQILDQPIILLPESGLLVGLQRTDECHPLASNNKLIGCWEKESGDYWDMCYFYPLVGGALWVVEDGEGGINDVDPPTYWGFLPKSLKAEQPRT